ncbi:hypothetical protein [Streptomyces sp. T028]|uniref:hypothetical protein n=1 Tax=Streptomyces sp. T028 TaxID=3394379 RepID=UPI003A8800C9
MARFEEPRPKRSDYYTSGAGGTRRTFMETNYNMAVSDWERRKREFYEAQQREREERQRQREERQQNQRNRRDNFRRGAAAAGAAFNIATSSMNPGLAGGALQGDNGDLDGFGEDWRNSAQTEQRDNQTRGHRQNTTYRGRQRGGSSGSR